MLQSTPVSQSAVSSAHKLASRNCGTAVGEEEEDTYDDETTH